MPVGDLSPVSLLAMVFGLLVGWQIYTVAVVLLLRLNNNAPLFGWREGVVSATILLGIAVAVIAIGGLWSISAFTRAADAFLAAIIAGGAAHQLWLCWQASHSSPSK